MADTVAHDKIEHLFRPIYELNIASIWALGGVATPIMSSTTLTMTGVSTVTAMGAGMVFVSLLYAYRGSP